MDEFKGFKSEIYILLNVLYNDQFKVISLWFGLDYAI